MIYIKAFFAVIGIFAVLAGVIALIFITHGLIVPAFLFICLFYVLYLMVLDVLKGGQ